MNPTAMDVNVMTPVSIPDDIVLMVIKTCKTGDEIDRVTLSSFYTLNKQYHRVMGAHREDIVEHYTVVVSSTSDYNDYVCYTFCGEVHRDGDRPAIIQKIYSVYEWYLRGKLHREGDLPAIIRIDDMAEWDESPAPAYPPYTVEGVSYTYEWYQHGKLHREGDLPAVISNNGQAQEWYRHGRRLGDGGKSTIVEESGDQE